MREKQIEELAQVIAHSCIDLVESSCGEGECCVSCLATKLHKEGATIQKWIPVTERLPEDRTQVLCFGGAYGWKSTKMARFTTCLEDYHEYDFEGQQRHGFFNYDSEYGYYEETDVTHWMPLPEPPKGE